MALIKSITFALAVLIASQASAVTLNALGQRLSTCQNLESDNFLVEFDNNFKATAKSLYDNDRLTTAIVASPECFRVATEIKLQLSNETIPFLGRALIKDIKILTKSQLLKDKSTPYSQSSIISFIKANSVQKYGIISFKLTEKIGEAFVDTKFQRLPSCFTSYGDWESFRISEENIDIVTGIQNGSKRALIWNGTFNCYKIGTKVPINVIKKAREEYGLIIPTQLYIVHYTNLTQKHAELLGEDLTKLKERMAKKKDLEGGYTTIIAFDYQKPVVPEVIEAQ